MQKIITTKIISAGFIVEYTEGQNAATLRHGSLHLVLTTQELASLIELLDFAIGEIEKTISQKQT
jgi:hypothetical protein